MYGQDGRLDVEFAYALKLDERSLRKLVKITGRLLESAELDWFRGMARRQRVEDDTIEEKATDWNSSAGANTSAASCGRILAYFENPQPDDWERLSKFDRLNGISTYGPDFGWLLDNTSIVLVEFAVPSVPDDKVKDFKESKHVKRPKVVKSESVDREAQREGR